MFALWDSDEGWLVEPGKVKFFIGGSSAQIRLRTSVTLTGDVHHAGPDRALTSSVSTIPVDPEAEPATPTAAPKVLTPLSGDNTVLEWLEHPVGGDLLRGLLQGADEETLAPAFGMSLKEMAMYSGGRITPETVDRLAAQAHAQMSAE
jgi:beta-glucosidase